MDKVFLRFDKKNCVGCHTCEVACKQEHGLGVGPRLVRIMLSAKMEVEVLLMECSLVVFTPMFWRQN